MLIAPLYDLVGRAAERSYLGERRHALLARARGEVLELGAGTGANLAHYPSAVERVTASEPDRSMRRRLGRRLREARVPVRVSEAAAERLPFADASFDVVVATLVLCSVEDPALALAETRRVLRPGGSVLFLEHVAAGGKAGAWQRRVQPVYGPLAGGCRLDRRTEQSLREAGFAVDVLERFLPPGPVGAIAPHVLGVAARGA